MLPQLTKRADSSLEIVIELLWPDIASTYENIITKLCEEIEISGFRKGKAPRDLAEKQIVNTRIYEETLKQIVPQAYQDAIKKLEIIPIISPRVELLEASKGKNWKLKITTCEKPQIDLNNYQAAVQKVYTDKKSQVWIPGKKDEAKDREPTIGEVLEALYKEVKVTLPSILVDQETNRLLSQSFDELKRLGLTVEQYLEAQGKTSESLRSEYREQAVKNLILEFALEEIADKEQVSVEQSEVDKVISDAKTPAEKDTLTKNRYYLSSLLRRQKTLAKLTKPSVIVAKNSPIITSNIA